MSGSANRLVRSLPAVAMASLALGACSLDPSSLPGGFMLGPTVKGQVVIGVPRNPIEHALAYCTEKTDAAETACVRQALVDGKLGPAALAGMIPGCKPGASCTLTYRTRDRMGLVAINATQYVADWLVTVDLKNPKATPADLPLTVQQI